jgi:Spy/CpxP family protein refolding chaperone
MRTMRWLKSSASVAAIVAGSMLLACGGESPAPLAPPPTPPAATEAPPPVASTPAPTATAAPTAAPAVPTGVPEQAEGDEHRRHWHGGVVSLVAMSLKDIDLTDDQRASVEKIKTDLAAKLGPVRAAGTDLANALADGVAAGKVDRAKADKAIEKLATAAKGVHDAVADAMNQLHNTLNAQQRATLVDKLSAHWEKWKEAQGQDEQDQTQNRNGHLLALVRDLGLSQDQAQKIKTSFKAMMKASPQETAHKEVQDHLKAFGTAFKADTFDAKKLTTATPANGHIARWGATRMARFLEAAAPVLTPDQRTKLADQIRAHASS